MRENKLRVCVLGLGQIGLPTAKYCLSKKLEVYGYDISRIAVNRAISEGIRASYNWSDIPNVDVYLICVSTLIKNGLPDLSSIFDVCEKIAKRSNVKTLVSIESTIIPGTSRKIYKEIFDKKVCLIHVPHRYWSKDPIRHGVKQLRVMGAIDNRSLNLGFAFYKNLLNIPLYIVSSIEIAEMCKIAENAYRYLQIAFAEELKMICEERGMNFEEVRKACNTKWNIEILEAREGIGGHCLPKDIRYLISMSQQYNTLLKAAIKVDKQYRKWLKTRDNKCYKLPDLANQMKEPQP